MTTTGAGEHLGEQPPPSGGLPDSPAGANDSASLGALILVAVLAAAIVGLTYILFGSVWLAEQFTIISGNPPSPVPGLIVTGMLGLTLALPSVWAGRRLRPPQLRAVAETWAAAGLFVLLCLPIRFADVTEGTLGAGLQIGCLLVFLLIARWRFPAPAGTSATPPYWPAIVTAALCSLWWVRWGAPGSWLDVVLNGVAALLLGTAAGVLARWRLLPALEEAVSLRAAIVLGGLTLSAALAAMGGALGMSGQQLILITVLSALGLLLMSLAATGRRGRPAGGWAAVGLCVALVAMGPLVFVDPEELILILNLGTRDVAYWALRATFLSAAVAMLLGLAGLWLAPRAAGRPSDWRGPAGAAVGLATVAAVFLLAGQPGFHGERSFVIMAEQTDWRSFDPPAGYGERRAAVYETLVGQSDRTQQPIRETLDRLGIDYTPYYLVNALEVDGGPLVRLWLSGQSEVDRILVSPRLRPLPEPPPISSENGERPAEPQWNLTSIGAPLVWQSYGVTGQGIVVGQADSGAELSHPELSPTYRGNIDTSLPGHDYNWFDPWTASAAPGDFGGHGTHTLGSIVGQSVGVAPGATWIACVNLERNLGNPALYLDCMQFLFAPFPLGGQPLRDGRPDLGAHVFNNSWGCPTIEGCDAGALLAAVQALRAAGVFVVASAGNEGDACGSVQSPIALYDEVFTVGAVDELGEVAFFSSRGPVEVDGSGRTKPDIAAPGVAVLSSFPNGSYGYSDGTSMAGPHVAGVVALLWSANPALIGDIDRTEAIITGTARPHDAATLGVPSCGDPDQTPDNATGYGLIDALAAVEAALVAAP